MNRRGIGPRAALLVAGVTVLAQAWMLDLPFQLDDYLLLPDPLAHFTHVERMREQDVPAFMCRMPMWIAWWLVGLVVREPWSPVPFHVFGLALHALAALLLARLVARHAPEELARRGAVIAGCLFGAAGGAMQAVSWTAAWSSLIYTLFALGALNLALDARARGTWGGTAGAALCLYLAVITKVPALVAVAAVLLLLFLSAAARGAWRRLAGELALCGLAIVLGMATRRWFLGTLHLRYEARVEPGLLELPGIVARGFHALGQALYPWNRDPLLAGEEPWLARLGLPAPALAALFCAPLLVAGLALAPRARPYLGALALALVGAVVPPGALYLGQATNVASREAYLPLAVSAAALGIAAAALSARRPALGAAALALLAVFVADGTWHVARSERLNGAEVRSTRALLDGVAAQAEAERPGRVPLVLALVPDGGFAGIPSMGRLLPHALVPPFAERARLEVRVFKSAAELRDWLASADVGARDVVVLGPEVDAAWEPLAPDPALGGAANRARRLLRPLTPLRPGRASAEPPLLPYDAEAGAWRADPPLPAHAAGALELALDDGAPLAGAFVFRSGDAEYSALIDDPGSPGTRLTLEVPAALPLRFGPPLASIAWRGSAPPGPLRVLPHVPLLAPLSPAPGTDFPTSAVRHTGPLFSAAAPPPDLRRGSFARLEVRFDLLGRAASVFSDFPAPAQGPLAHTPAALHLDAAAPAPILEAAPWSVLLDDRILPALAAGRLRTATFQWRLTLHHPGGTPAARTPFQTARFVLSDPP